ncbi:MAG: trypsin-like serine protease, partial [Candidatus Zixiibacteriota bacterium]
LACAIALVLVGCQTSGSTSGEVKYGMFFSPADHIEELLAQHDYQAASDVYEREREYFSEDSEKRHLVANELAKQLLLELEPGLVQARVGLDGIVWPTVVEIWPATKLTIANGEKVLRDFREHQILTEDAYRPSSAVLLELGLEAVKNNISASADVMFRQYDIRRQENFFDVYPVDLSRGAFFVDKSWDDKLDGLTIVDLKRVLDNYDQYLSYGMKVQLGTRFYEERLAQSTTEKSSSLRQIIAAISATEKSGFEVNRIPGAKVALVEVTSKTLLKKGEIEFPISIDVDLPFEAAKADIDKAFDNPIARNADIIILLDVALAKTDRVIEKLEQVASEYQSGTRSEPNQSYAQAQNLVNAAQMELQSAQISKAGVDAEYCNGWGCLTKAISQAIYAGVVAEKHEQYQAAMSNLNATPIMVEKPVYSPYTFNKAYIDDAKVATVNYYVIDRRSKTYFRDTFVTRQTESFVVAYEVDPNERNRYSQLKDTNEEDEVARFEEAEIDISLSSIIDQFLVKNDEVSPLPALAAIQKQILSDKNRALAAVKDRDYTAVPARQDARFESTVVIYNPGGSLGSGFFVSDDTVLTNYHVIEGTKFVEVKMFNGQESFGKVVANDIRLDLALVKVQARGVPVQFLGEKEIRLGETVEAIGHPNGLEFTITRGIISAMREQESRYTPGAKKIRMIQTDTAINPGNSGGPLFLGNKVIGVNNNKIVGNDVEGIGFAIHYS